MVQDGPRSPRARRHRRPALAAAAAAAAFAGVVGIASGAVGDLTYSGCITGEQQTGPAPGTGACAAIPSITPNGSQSGIDNPQAMAVSPDGKSLYLASGNDAAVARFDRDTTTGALTYQGCITGEIESGPVSGGGNGACAAAPVTTSNGFNSGFDNLRSIAVSADGSSVYAVSGGDDAILRFTRDAATGALTFNDCLTGETQSQTSGACTALGGGTSNGTDSGLDFLTSVAVSPDGLSVYVGSSADDSVVRFNRTGAGALSFAFCFTGEGETGPGGTNRCAAIPSTAAIGNFGNESGLDDVVSLVVSPDNEFLYALAQDDDAVARFDRLPATGSITYLSCVTGETESVTSGACTAVPGATAGGVQSGLDRPFAIAIASGGGSLYAVSHDDDAIAGFSRDGGTGALTFQSCTTGEAESGPAPGGSGACGAIPGAVSNGFQSGLDELYSLAGSADGRNVYAVSQGDDGVATFTRDPGTGALTYKGCASGEAGSGPSPGTGACSLIAGATVAGESSGLDKPRSLAVSADNTSLYAGSPADDAVTRFGREPEPAVLPPPVETCFGVAIDGASITGDEKGNKINGTARSDQLRGAGGNDTIRGDDAADCLFGNGDKDKVRGDKGDDVIRGGSGNDKLTGGKDDDTIRAQDGDDKVNGGSGDDEIKAQARGRDKINCGSGTDRVVGDAKDTIAKNCENVRIVDPN